jgi:2,3-bisphosphoglycerate-independent phosphoglycerate mutase
MKNQMKNQNSYQYGLAHGRFQPFHNDHLKYVLAALEKVKFLYIGITNPDPMSTKYHASNPERSSSDANPFTYYQRMEMVSKSLYSIGITSDRFAVIPFPINMPEIWRYYAPNDAVYFLTIYDEWGKKKLSMLTEQNLQTEVLWKKSLKDKEITGTQIRNSMKNGTPWRHLLPKGTSDVIDNLYKNCKINLKGKIYVIIIDGGADRAILKFNGKTPFEAANTPNLDYMAKNGVQGVISLINEDISPESDSGTMSLLSYDPLKYYTGRGPLEGLGVDFIDMDNDNSVSFRMQFASYNEKTRRLDRRTAVGLSNEELQLLTNELRQKIKLNKFNDVNFKIMSYRQHRGIISFSSNTKKFSGNISNTDPGIKKIGAFGIPQFNYIPSPLECYALESTDEGNFTASVVNAFIAESKAVLTESEVNKKRIQEGKTPINILLVGEGGDNPKPLQSFKSKFMKNISLYGQIPAERGLAKLIGGKFSYLKIPEFIEEKEFLQEAAGKIVDDSSDVICIHILKSADEAGHFGDPIKKVKAIERFDKNFMGTFLKYINPSDTCIITCDHATPCELKVHSPDLVPLLIYGDKIKSDKTNFFGESFAAKGELKIKHATQVLPYVLNL